MLPQDRIIPFLGGGSLLRSSTLPEDSGVVVALGGAPVELVVATDVSLNFLQVTPDPMFVFRVLREDGAPHQGARAIDRAMPSLHAESRDSSQCKHHRRDDATRVIVLGGGVAGMSAAHELIERGFEVVVLERRDIAGGKARSIPVIDDGAGTSGHELADSGVASDRASLPGEHGFRFFPGFYKHVIDTMRRIPSFDGRKVADHLVPTTRVGITQYGKPHLPVPATFPRTPGDAGTLLRDILLAFGPITELTPDDLAFFGARIWQILTSCEQRRLGEYERTSWWDVRRRRAAVGVLPEVPRRRASRARWWRPRRGRPAPAPSATCSFS